MRRFFAFVGVCLLVGCGDSDPQLTKAEIVDRIPAAAPTEDGIAVAIVYDTSGSMGEVINTKHGTERKHVVGIRALKAVADRLTVWAVNNQNKKIEVGIYTFDGDAGGKAILPLSILNTQSFNEGIKNVPSPEGSTPLGPTMELAGRALLKSNQSHRHMIVISDGENNRGASPQAVLKWVTTAASEKSSTVGTYFIAMDMNSDVFKPVREQGASLFSADDENSLNTQLTFVLEKKILLEDEEPQVK